MTMSSDWLKTSAGLVSLGILALGGFVATRRQYQVTADMGLGESFEPSEPSESTMKHVSGIARILPVDSDLRYSLEGGTHGRGNHEMWMDRMRAEGVRIAFFEVYFTWFGGPRRLRIVRVMYFSEYDGPNAQITDPNRIGHIRQSDLDEELGKAATQQVAHSGWFFETPAWQLGRRGIGYVTLYDDEWIPHFPPVLQPFDSDRSDLLQSAALGDQIRLAELLSLGREKRTELNYALFAAVGDGIDKTAVTRMLLKAGADVNARDANGETPLVRAARNGKPSQMRVLLEDGADAAARDRNGQSILTMSEQHSCHDSPTGEQKCAEMAALLKDAGTHD
jgi:ankyrin repeat protein